MLRHSGILMYSARDSSRHLLSAGGCTGPGRYDSPFSRKATDRILVSAMKHLALLLTGALILVLVGTVCQSPADPDARHPIEVTELSGLSTAGVESRGARSAETDSWTANSGAMNLTASQPVHGQPVDSQPRAEPQEGELQMAALARSYPQRIEEFACRNGDWAVRIDTTWYYWAHGRLLPEELRDRWEEYSSYRFYSYALDLPPIPELDEETRLRLKQRLDRAEENPPMRHEGFLGDLYRASTRRQTEAGIVTVELLGFEVRVHQQIAEPLEAVGRDLEVLMQTDPGVQRFAKGLKGLAGYNWREIAGTRSRSYHSYGIAVDLAPKSFGGRHTYWRWALPKNEEFYAIPYEQRWMVPQQIVEIFEQWGFVWGGKWFFFDTMHFEYRPEILALANVLEDQR